MKEQPYSLTKLVNPDCPDFCGAACKVALMGSLVGSGLVALNRASGYQ